MLGSLVLSKQELGLKDYTPPETVNKVPQALQEAVRENMAREEQFPSEQISEKIKNETLATTEIRTPRIMQIFADHLITIGFKDNDRALSMLGKKGNACNRRLQEL